MRDHELAQMVIRSNSGIFKVIKNRREDLMPEGAYITEKKVVELLNHPCLKVAICDENNRIFEKNFKGAFDL